MRTKSQVAAMDEAYKAFLKDCEHLGITPSSEIHYAWTRAWIASHDHQRMQGAATIADRAEPQPEPQGDGWITWGGGECPVIEDVMVEIKCNNGSTDIGQAKCFYWGRGLGGSTITTYRLA